MAKNHRLKKVLLADVPNEQARNWAWMFALTDNGEYHKDAHYSNGGRSNHVTMDYRKHFIYDPHTDMPAIALLDEGRKAYLLDMAYRPGQDASDLPLYDEVWTRAANQQEKDAETCFVVIEIHFGLVKPLLDELLTEPHMEEVKREIRGKIMRAKFNTVRLWNEGKLRKAGEA